MPLSGKPPPPTGTSNGSILSGRASLNAWASDTLARGSSCGCLASNSSRPTSQPFHSRRISLYLYLNPDLSDMAYAFFPVAKLLINSPESIDIAVQP